VSDLWELNLMTTVTAAMLLAGLFVVSPVKTSAGLSRQEAALPEELLDPSEKVQQLATGMQFTEGPVWLPDRKTLVFSDIPRGKLLSWSAADGPQEYRSSENSNGNLLDLQGRLLTCQHSGRNIVRTEGDGSLTVLVDRFEGQRLNSPNDLIVKSDGTIWFTDPSYGLGGKPGELPGKWVYRLDPDSGDLRVVSKHFDMPNGIVFAPNEKILYVADTGKLGKILGFEVTANGTALGKVLHEIDVRSDGMCVDASGNLYTTTRQGVQVFSPRGAALGTLPLPEVPANVCFGSDDFKTLFITARTSLYAVVLKVAGHQVRSRDTARPPQESSPER
jgi:gluconolactonase